MPITPEQAKAELARRELERRGISLGEKPQSNILQDKIASRPDLYQESAQAMSTLPQDMWKATQGTIPMPGLPLVSALLKGIGGVAQRAESTVANPFIMKDGKPQNPLVAMAEGVTGKQRGELGDIGVQAGIPQPIASALGLVGTGMIGGSISKLFGSILGNTAKQATKVVSSYGSDVGGNVIRWLTGMPKPAVQHGMKRGWKNVLTKANIDSTLPTKLAANTLDDLSNIANKEYQSYGKAIDKVNKGFVKGSQLSDNLQQVVIKHQYITPEGAKTIKVRPPIIDEIEKLWGNIGAEENIPIKFLQDLRTKLKEGLPTGYWKGKVRSLSPEQNFAKEALNKVDELIGFHAQGISGKELLNAKRSYREFKDAESMIMNTFSETVGQQTMPTADKVVGVFKLHPTKAYEEMGKIQKISDFLQKKGGTAISDKLFDWLTTQEALINIKSGTSVGPFRAIEQIGKFTTGKALQSGIPSALGKGIESAGRGIGSLKSKTNLIPAMFMRGTRDIYSQE